MVFKLAASLSRIRPQTTCMDWRRAFGVALSVSMAGSLFGQNPLPNMRPNASAPQAAPASPLQLPNTNAPASDARLQVYNLPLEFVGTFGAKLQLQYAGDKRVRITNEPSSGRLMVMAPEAVQQQVAAQVQAAQRQVGSLITDMNGNVVPNTIQQRQYKLQRISWRELEDAVGRLAGTRLTVRTSNNGELAQLHLVGKDGTPQELMQVDRRNDTVRLQGTPTNVMAWTQVVTAIDLGQADPNRPTQIVPIAPATQERVERALKFVRLASYRGQPQDESAAGQPRLDENDPTTVIAAPDAVTSGTGLIGDVDISFVPEMGLVIIKGSKRDVQRVLEVIEQIKKQSLETAPDIELITLKHVNGQALETIIRDLNRDVFQPRQGQISITALGQPNALLLIGRKEAMVNIIDLINRLDQPLEPNSQFRVFRMVNSSAVDAEELIKSFFPDSQAPGAAAAPGGGADTGSRGNLNARIKVVSDYRTNSLIVQASPRDLSEVARLVKDIDVESTPAENEIRVFPIKNAVAAELQPILQTAISGQSSSSSSQGGQQGQQGQQGQGQQSSTTSSRATPPSSRLLIVPRKDGVDGRQVESGILAGVVVTTNPSINALIVRAPSKSMPLITALIDQLDQLPSADARIKVFEVINGDATSLALTLQQVFGLPATAGASTTAAATIGLQNLATLTGGGDSSLVPLRISVDLRTNSIIASGSPSDLDVIEVLLVRLDDKGGQQRSTEVIWLRNSAANDVATAITTLVNNQRTIINQQLQTGQAISLYERTDREVFVVAEPTTNSLIVSATPRYFPQIRSVIERLDRQQPMIAVEILIAEVTLDDTVEFGTEFGLQDALLFQRNSASGGTLSSPGFNQGTALGSTVTKGLPQNVAGQGTSGFALGRSNSTLGYGGLVLAAGSQSVNVLFRALQDANRVQILSRPNLMTIDNNISVVQVGSSVPTISGTSQSTIGGAIQNQIIYQPVGLIMQIQPRTNQDGLINMIVAVNRSSLGPTDSGIPVSIAANGDPIRAPIINVTLAQTRVTAYDGQTVILGGLITKNRTSKSRRIPFLADIPLAGSLFRFDSQTESRTELLVIMTPRVINFNDPGKLEMIKQVESSRMSWCMADILNIHGDVGLSPGNGLWGPAASPVIYPDLQPTVEYDNHDSIDGTPQPIPPMNEIYSNEGEMIEGYPIQAPVRSNGPRSLIRERSDNSNPPVSSAQPIQNTSYQGNDGNGYSVAPAAYRDPASPPQGSGNSNPPTMNLSVPPPVARTANRPR